MQRFKGSVTLALAALIMVPLVAAGCSVSDVDNGVDTAETAPLLFTLTSAGSRIKAGESEPDGYQLLLDHVDDHSVWFTDRPDRASGVFSTGNLISGWSAFGFAEVPPNVALITHGQSGESETAIVTLTNPQFDSRYRVFMADITFVNEQPMFMPSRGSEVDLGQMSLFIDDAVVQLPDQVDSDAGADWKFHSIIPTDDGSKYVKKSKVNISPLDAEKSNIFSIPAADLISNFSDHHLDLVHSGVALYGEAKP